MKVADLCAGTGFYGFEAISRGVEKVFFFELEVKGCNLIENIARSFNIDRSKYEIIRGDVTKSLKFFSEFYSEINFDLIFFDPPYKATFLDEVFNLVSDYNLLSRSGYFVVETSDFRNLVFSGFKVFLQRDYGGSRVVFLEKG